MPNVRIKVSIIVCTCNRPESLERLLASVARLGQPPDLSWEMILVDNGKDGSGAKVAARYAQSLPLRTVVDPTPGLSHVRNRGVAEARGEYICWTDDDCEVDPNWLFAWTRAFRRHPDAAVFGGNIVPTLEQPAPGWFEQCLSDWPLQAVTAARCARSVTPVAVTQLPWGANFAVRSVDQRRFPFDAALGHAPGRRITGEESDVVYRLLKSGAQGWWVPDSRVRHHIGRERQTRAHILNYFRTAGETASLLRTTAPGDNANEANRRRGMVHLGTQALLFVWGASTLLSQLSHVPGLRKIGVRFLARRGLCRGIWDYRRRRETPPNPVLREAGSMR